MTIQTKTSRRKFLSRTAAASLGFTIVPSSVLASPAPSDRLNFGHIGIGGRGRRFLRPLSQLDEPALQWENLGGPGDRRQAQEHHQDHDTMDHPYLPGT